MCLHLHLHHHHHRSLSRFFRGRSEKAGRSFVREPGESVSLARLSRDDSRVSRERRHSEVNVALRSSQQ
jgi:hypothetical protein